MHADAPPLLLLLLLLLLLQQAFMTGYCWPLSPR
jgi:hypothetical protein